ncbi:MAG: transglycosylase SLT domain-containing protein [Rhodospirillaceae bacterium]|nr:transglycosylase SLT domain-containing protein [Rhodospirillaceae bacterium]MCA8934050.1 transglycosylase SLT domain-containing protein [Rhodospirillaceae bacterium]
MTLVHTFGPYRVTDTVLSAVRDASARTGVDFRYMMAKAATESAFNPHARAATSNATGLYQFINSTWIAMVHNHGDAYGLGAYAAQIVERPDGTLDVPDPAMRQQILGLRDDPALSAYMAAEYALENRTYLEQTVGGTIGATELYLGHFLGAHGAARFLSAVRSDPQTIGAHLFPAAAAANGPAFYRDGRALTVREIYDLFDTRVETDMARVDEAFGPSEPMPVIAGGVLAEAPLLSGPSFFVNDPVRSGFFQGGAPAATVRPYAPTPFPAAVAGPAFTAVAQAAGAGTAAPAGGRSLSLWAVLTASADPAVS